MIITKKVTVKLKISNQTFDYFKELGYDIKLKEECEINVNDLPNTSKYFIDVMCDECKKEFNISVKAYHTNVKKNDKYLCHSCSYKKSMLKKHGVENISQTDVWKKKFKKKYEDKTEDEKQRIIEKRKQTTLEKHRVIHHMKVSDIAKKVSDKHKLPKNIRKRVEVTKKTSLKKYGIDWPSKSDVVKEKVKKTNLNKTESEKQKVINQRKETNIKKYGSSHYLISKEYFEKRFIKYKDNIKNRYKDINIKEITQDGKIEFFCDSCNDFKILPIHLLHQRYKYTKKLCLDCNPLYGFKSGSEDELKEFIKSLGFSGRSNRKILNGKELDVYIPSEKIAIEFNGLFWHSEVYKDKEYHIEKTKNVNKRGISLIHIWEDDWLMKKDIVKSRISNILNKNNNRIFARKCVIKELSSKESRMFLDDNHTQGYVNSKIRLGLYYNDVLVSLMTFGDLRNNLGQKHSENSYELLRFVNKKYTSVVGGASKLFKHFVKVYKPVKIVSYADRDWTNYSKNSLYDKLGFKFMGDTGLNYWWIVDGKRENRFKYRKDVLISEGYDKNKTEIEIMHDRGYFRIFGTGNLKFLWSR